jgi:hypothetical protein
VRGDNESLKPTGAAVGKRRPYTPESVALVCAIGRPLLRLILDTDDNVIDIPPARPAVPEERSLQCVSADCR